MSRRSYTFSRERGEIIKGAGRNFLVVAQLGLGGTAETYLVKDKDIGRMFALKLLSWSLAHRNDLRIAFEQEARALAHLRHPNIVEVFQLDRTADSRRVPFYLMEALQGESVRKALHRRGTFNLRAALKVMCELLPALYYAHSLGVVHRDIKPDNVFLHTGITSEQVVKLIDFGIFKLIYSQATPGVFMGTPRYAPPEQLMGSESIGPAADIYSAGVMLFEMLTGKTPFDRFGLSHEGMLQAISVDAPLLSDFGKFPPELVNLVARALVKNPDKRMKDAFSLAKQLETIRDSINPNTNPGMHVTEEVVVTFVGNQEMLTAAHVEAPTWDDDKMAGTMRTVYNQHMARGDRDPVEVVPELADGADASEGPTSSEIPISGIPISGIGLVSTEKDFPPTPPVTAPTPEKFAPQVMQVHRPSEPVVNRDAPTKPPPSQPISPVLPHFDASDLNIGRAIMQQPVPAYANKAVTKAPVSAHWGPNQKAPMVPVRPLQPSQSQSKPRRWFQATVHVENGSARFRSEAFVVKYFPPATLGVTLGICLGLAVFFMGKPNPVPNTVSDTESNTVTDAPPIPQIPQIEGSAKVPQATIEPSALPSTPSLTPSSSEKVVQPTMAAPPSTASSIAMEPVAARASASPAVSSAPPRPQPQQRPRPRRVKDDIEPTMIPR
ncbi:MAG: serine/threonine protein kinase [Polyangiaceae bacterium]|nr:serine/threonine protein kinase [Polyangiaceae bacterium]